MEITILNRDPSSNYFWAMASIANWCWFTQFNGDLTKNDLVGPEEMEHDSFMVFSYWKLPFIVDFPMKNGDFP